MPTPRSSPRWSTRRRRSGSLAARRTAWGRMCGKSCGMPPVLAAYNVPGRDCAQYSAGGAPTGDAYRAWIDGFAAGLESNPAIVLLEPDGLALLPTDCGQPDTYNRVGLINYAVHALLRDPNAAIYLDAGHSA